LLVKVGIAPLVAGLIVLIIFARQVYITSGIERDAAAINLAGSQRMRLFKLVLLTEQYLEHREPKIRALIDQEMTTFEAILHGFKHGDPRYTLKSMDNPELIVFLDKSGDEWNKTIKPLFQNVLAASASRETLRTLKDHVEEYVKRIDTLVALLQADSEKKVDALHHLLRIFLLANIAIGLGSLIYIHLIILKPLKMFAETSRAMAAGDLSRVVPVLSKDEIGELASDFNEMSARLENHIETLHQKTVELEAQKALIETDRRAILGLKKYAYDIIASLPAGLIVVDDVLEVLSVNRSFRELFGLRSGEAVGGQDIAELLPLPGLREQAQGVLASGTAVHGIEASLGGKWLRLAITGIRLAEEEEEEEERLLVMVEDITERKAAEARIEQLAFYDPLTGLPNRALCLDRLQQGIAAASRHGRALAVMFVDLDGFKHINDSLGHDAGDRLLQEAARRLTSCVREADTVARLGGDEFVVILDEMTEEAAGMLARKLLGALRAPLAIDGHTLHVTCSIGIALYPRDATDARTLLRNADAAMYRAKQEERNAARFYTEEMNRKALERLALEEDLHRALERGEFLLHYQPRVDLVSGEITGFEALVRWRHPHKGLIPPDRFIPVAEETGLILPLGAWVLREACTQAVAWARQGLDPGSMAVNLSARQFRSPDLVDKMAGILRETGLAPGGLELEITESMVASHVEQAIATLDRLKALGVRLAIDDFGTGYSSLSQLKRFPVQVLKIDKSFIAGIPSDPDDATIVTAILSMAHAMHLDVVAEGVETEAQLAFLRRHGCDEMQGYFFSKPLPAEAAQALLAEGQRLAPDGADGVAGSRTLLLVDDEEHMLSALSRVLRRDGYRILKATSAKAAFDLLAQHPVGVIVCGLRMPELSGTEFLRRVRQIHPQTVRIVLSGYTELTSVTDAINEGAVYKFLTKPWEDDLLRANIKEAFQHFELARDRQRLAEELARAREQMEARGE